jgi:hypothetical protein
MTTRQNNVNRYIATLRENWEQWCAVLDTLSESDKLALRNDIRYMLGIDDIAPSCKNWNRAQREVIALFCS